MGPTDPMEGGSGWGDRPGGTHLAEELVVILRDEQEAAAERLGLLLQLGGQRVGVSTPACPKPPQAEAGPSSASLCPGYPYVPHRARCHPRTSSLWLIRFTLETNDREGKAVHSEHC